MGFLDKLFGRAKETAGDVADTADPHVDKAQDAAGDAWDKTKGVADDVADTASDTPGGAEDEARDAVDTTQDTAEDTGSGPTAA